MNVSISMLFFVAKYNQLLVSSQYYQKITYLCEYLFNLTKIHFKSIRNMDHSQNDIAQLISSHPSRTKTSKQLSTIVRYLFQNPKNIGSKFSKLGRPQKYHKGHHVDIGVLFKLYQNINKLKLNESVSQALKKSLESLQNRDRLEQFLKNKQNITFFFIIMFWDKLFLIKENNLNLLKFLNLVEHFGPLKPSFSTWCDDIPGEYLKVQVSQLLSIIQIQFDKLRPGAVAKQLIHIVQLNIHNICQFLSILNESNKRVPRIQTEHFIMKNLGEYFKAIDIFKIYLTKGQTFNFVKYPFLLTLDFKYSLLRIQSVYQQKSEMQKNVTTGLYRLMSGNIELDADGGISLESLAYLHFQINRNNILNDSMEKLGKVKHNLKNPLRIKFIGEEGTDQGGVQNEYFQLLTKQIFNPYLDMFLAKNNGRVYWFNGFSFQPPIRFQFVGMLLGLAIYNSVHLDVRFPKMLYKKLLSSGQIQLDVNELLEELNQIQPQYYRSMKQILDSNQSLDALQLYFNIQVQNFGEKIVEQLVEDGSSIKLTQDNKHQYVYMYCQHLLNKHIEKQFRSFKKGFDKVVNTSLIKMFTPDELEIIICGKQIIDFKDLQANTHYEGYTKDSPVIKNLWKILHNLEQPDKKNFLMFCTGSDRVPLAGLKSLNFLVQKHANPTHLPSAHTCFNVLLLPQYQTIQKLKKNIQFILKNNQGFGLI